MILRLVWCPEGVAELPTTAGTVLSSVFARAAAQVAIAAGKDDTLPMLTGVRFEIDGDRLTLAATDRYRLAIRELNWWRQMRNNSPCASTVKCSGLASRTRRTISRALTCRALPREAKAVNGISATSASLTHCCSWSGTVVSIWRSSRKVARL